MSGGSAPFASAAGSGPAEEPDDAEPLEAGTVIGGTYEIEALLGRGASGVVYRARHRTLHRSFALKIVRVARGARAALPGQRLMREARTTSSLRHENVVDVTDLDHTADGLVFVAMELLEGEDLARRIERGRLEDDEVRQVVDGILAGVETAHAAGIVHRDLKPANVFLARRAEQTVVKVLDFGLSIVIGAEQSVRLTHSGQLVGTPLYMAPEQSRAEEVDARSDVYSLGVMLYQLLTGSVPFPAATLYESVLSHATVTPPSLAARRPDLPAAVVAVVERCLEKRPEARFADASALRIAWRASWGAASPPRAKHRRARGPIVVLAVAIACGSAVLIWAVSRAPAPSPIASASGRSRAAAPLEPSPSAEPARAGDPPSPAPFTLRTSPPGALVYDARTRLGETPLVVALDRSHELTLRRPGYRVRRITVERAQLESPVRLRPILAER